MSRKLVGWLSFIGAFIALQYAAEIAAKGTQDKNELYKYSTAVGGTVEYLIMLAIVLWIAGRRRDLLALRRPRAWVPALGLAVLALVACDLAIQLVLEPILHGAREQGAVPSHWEPAHAGAFAANWALVALLDPVVEELTFRGLGLSLLLERVGRGAAILLIGLLFAAAHGLFQAFPELALFGCALAWLRLRTDSVYPGMLVHGAFNSIALASVLFAPR
jgi:membrane protease YdiL (CAAX protease family)